MAIREVGVTKVDRPAKHAISHTRFRRTSLGLAITTLALVPVFHAWAGQVTGQGAVAVTPRACVPQSTLHRSAGPVPSFRVARRFDDSASPRPCSPPGCARYLLLGVYY
jgi:hypothetical protein